MGYTKQMADDNRQARELAKELLPAIWNYFDEQGLGTRQEVKDYIGNALATVAEQIKPQLSSVPIKRIRSQVANVMVKERGKARKR